MKQQQTPKSTKKSIFTSLNNLREKSGKMVGKAFAAVGAVSAGAVALVESKVSAAGTVPTVSLTYDLADVATGTGNWFSSLWLIVAFAVAIPLAFLIARNIKELFIA